MASKGGGKIGGGGLYITAKEFAMIGKSREYFRAIPSPEEQDHLLSGFLMMKGIFVNDREADEYLATTRFKKTLDSADAFALGDYTTSGYSMINANLRAQVERGIPLNKTIQTLSANLDQALTKLPAYKGEVYRSINLNPREMSAFLTKYRSGRTVTFPAYTSTSTQTGQFREGNVAFRIQSKGRHGKTVLRLATIAGEREVLFERGTKFRVGKVTPTGKTKAEVVLYEI